MFLLVGSYFRTQKKCFVGRLSDEFQNAFNCQNCVDILGFDPFSYELYDEETQEKIESGKWMEKGVECMQLIIKIMHPDQ